MSDTGEDRRVRVSVGVEESFVRLLALHADDVASLFPNQLEAIKTLALAAQKRWINYASGMPLPDGRTIRRWTGTYAASIHIEHDGELRYTIYSDDPKADIIERGSDAWDMRKLLWTSHKTRINAAGKRYLILPFRHGTPGTTVVGQYANREMPVPVHQWWLARDRDTWTSVVTSTFTEPSVQDPNVRVLRRRYAWGDRLTAGDVAELGLDPEREGRNLVGMVRFDAPQGRHGEYVTFRTMGEDGDGWQQPARDGKYPARAALDFVMEHAQGALDRALEADLERLKTMLDD